VRFVLDASVAIAWCFEAGETEAADQALAAFLTGGTAVVPSLWRLEVANVLLVAERRGRSTPAETTRCLSLLDGLPITVMADGNGIADHVAVARSHGLTAYDAAYLDLAMREGLPLATLDRELAAAARAAGVGLLGA
jgi:predicted nucleic acid-binding protein